MQKNLRVGHASLAIYSGLLLTLGYYLQFSLGLLPCPLCLMQRVMLFCLVIIFFLVALHNPKREGMLWVYRIVIFIASTAGLVFALRQIWLQWYPPENQACLPNLLSLLECFPWQEIVRLIFVGSEACAKESWIFLGLSMPAWSSVGFLSILIAELFLIIRQK